MAPGAAADFLTDELTDGITASKQDRDRYSSASSDVLDGSWGPRRPSSQAERGQADVSADNHLRPFTTPAGGAVSSIAETTCKTCGRRVSVLLGMGGMGHRQWWKLWTTARPNLELFGTLCTASYLSAKVLGPRLCTVRGLTSSRLLHSVSSGLGLIRHRSG